MYTIGPARVKYLLPYFPDNLPLIGAITDRVTEYGNIKSPVIRGLYSKISCKKNGSRILSSKRDGGLGILSIKRILNQPGDEFDVDYNDTTFTAMVKIVDRALA